MEIFLTTVFLSVIVRLILNAIRDRGPLVPTIAPERESICLYCIHAHVARGYSVNQEITYCTYAGKPRQPKFAVSDCSMFCHRQVGSRIVRVIGFADIVNESVSPQIAAKARVEMTDRLKN